MTEEETKTPRELHDRVLETIESLQTIHVKTVCAGDEEPPIIETKLGIFTGDVEVVVRVSSEGALDPRIGHFAPSHLVMLDQAIGRLNQLIETVIRLLRALLDLLRRSLPSDEAPSQIEWAKKTERDSFNDLLDKLRRGFRNLFELSIVTKTTLDTKLLASKVRLLPLSETPDAEQTLPDPTPPVDELIEPVKSLHAEHASRAGAVVERYGEWIGKLVNGAPSS